MIHLILDTNIWIYLANGFNSGSNKYEKEAHFEIFSNFLNLIKSSKIQVYTNEIIFKEWRRNKENNPEINTEAGIKKIKDKINSTKSSFNSIKEYIDSNLFDSLKAIENNYTKNLELLIKKNQEHVEKVQETLYGSTIKIHITEDLKLKVIELASDNKFPFAKNKNVTNDALIIYSSADYFNKGFEDMSINLFFISNNHKDYCEEKELHLEFKNIFKNEIKYESNLARALELSNKLIKANEDYNRIQEFTENKHIDSNETYCLANCEGPDFTLDYFPLDEIRELKSNKYIIKGKQQSLFQNELLDLYINRINLINSVTVNIGFCPFCSTMHIECECDEIFCENDFEENIYTCRCGNIYCMEGDTLILRNVA